jgi:hypothetical protein
MAKSLLDIISGTIGAHYKSDLADDIIRPIWKYANGVYEGGVHKFTVLMDEVIYEKANIGELRVKTYHDSPFSTRKISRWLNLFMISYHSRTLNINPNINWTQLFSGMDISNRVFTYVGENNIGFGDLTVDILNGRPPRFAYLGEYTTHELIERYKDLLDGVIYVEIGEQYYLEQGLFPNFEFANIYLKGCYLNNEFEYIGYYTPGQYLQLISPRGQNNKR